MDYLVLILCLYLLWGLFQAFSSVTGGGRKDRPSNLPPGPRPLPIVGNLLQLGDLPHKSLAKLASAYGPIIKLELGFVTTVVISSPALAKEILQARDAVFSHRMVPDSAMAHDHDKLSVGWVPVSPLFRYLRKIYNLHILSSKKLDLNQHLRSKKVQELITFVRKCACAGEAVNISEAAFRTSLNAISNTIFSLDVMEPSNPAGELKEVMGQIMVEIGKPNLADYFPVLKKIGLHGQKRRVAANFKKVFDIFDDLIERRLQLRKETGSIERNDVLDNLLDLVEDKNETLDMSLVKHLLLDVFIAGSETTASTLEWAMTELLCNPEKLLRAQAELHLVIGKGKQIEEADISRLPYLQAIVKENFRLHPVAPLLVPRKSGEDFITGGFTIPKGAQVLINVWAMGRDPSIWDDPGKFMPDRFLGSDIDVRGQNFELLPFGGGKRICPGLPLAMRMLPLMLGSLINVFDWKLEQGVTPENLNMEDKFGIAIQRAEPLNAVPIPI
ncbi:geraniol 8-hydroxylase-like [Rhodamnia argentea]|uniref:Geraniol 8-hydroxylase-like n=1 Tax=Rhodamnia argentea TaxID=178133 RepID=A0A8B8N8M7_9MYRT|nr:geraniol 8-hydroxylase-like [Rhodamnia argentea]